MTTVQIIGVSVAGVAVLLLIVALIVTRRRGKDDDQDEARPQQSFLDQAPQDTFSVLGKPEQDVEDITIDPAYERSLAAEQAAARAQQARQPQPGGLGLDWGPDLSVRGLEPEPLAAPSWGDDPEITGELRADEAEITGELRPSADTTGELPADAEAVAGEPERPVAVEPARPVEGEPERPVAVTPAAGEAAPESGPKSRLVPLSDIIVTTSGKMVDLQDPDVRRMLTELVTFEIDQAADFRRRGQTIDAVLQLTEAEKVSRALGMTESAQRIRAMMEEIRQEG
jgi:hypothetical protein